MSRRTGGRGGRLSLACLSRSTCECVRIRRFLKPYYSSRKNMMRGRSEYMAPRLSNNAFADSKELRVMMVKLEKMATLVLLVMRVMLVLVILEILE